MKKMKINLIAIGLLVFAFSGCNQNTKQTNVNSDSLTVTNKIDSKAELEKWKKELLDNKLVGKPCDFNVADDASQQKKWNKENPDLMDGLPKDENKYGISKYDFNSDGKEDLLLFFMSENCTGHNGSSPSFAKIIYSDGTFNSSLMKEIQTSILEEFNKKRTTDKKLKEITTDYMNETTTVTFSNNTINGNFNLYTKNDAHCCPTYNGKYTYNAGNKKIEIQITEANK